MGSHWKLGTWGLAGCSLSGVEGVFFFLPDVYQEGYAVGYQRGNDPPTDVCEPRRDCFREDAEVEEDDGDLGDRDDELVDVLIVVEVLIFDVRRSSTWACIAHSIP